MWRVQLFELNYDRREAEAVQQVLESGWITMGERTVTFEAAFESMLGSGRCAAVSSGTAALHIALLALGVGPGDEVIVPALTFVAAANVVRLVGARPVFVDCESYDVWNCDLSDVERRITSRTKAVTCVHYAGYPCRMEELVSLCHERGVPLIEDVAHAPGGSLGGRMLGTWGDIGCFSFFTNKNLSIGEGGMVAARDEALFERIRHLRSHGMTALTMDRHKGRAISYGVVRPGLNYRIDEMRAALGSVQLAKLADGNEERRRLTLRYHDSLQSIEGLHLPFRQYDVGKSAYHIYPVLLGDEIDRNLTIESLRARGIQASIHYPRIADFEAYSGYPDTDCPTAGDISRRELTLPLYPTMGDDKLDSVCDALEETLGEVS